MVRSLQTLILFLVLPTLAWANPNDKQLVLQAHVGEKNQFTEMLYDESARQAFGSDLLNQIKVSQAGGLVYVVETLDYKQAVVYLVVPPSGKKKTIKLKIEVLTEKPKTDKPVPGCATEDKMAMDRVDRYLRCYSDSRAFAKEIFYPTIDSATKLGTLMKDTLEYFVSSQGLSAEVAVEAYKLSPQLRVMREHLKFVSDAKERHHFPRVLLQAWGFSIDLRTTELWRQTTPGVEEAQMVVAAAEYLKQANLVFVDRNFNCQRISGPALISTTELKACSISTAVSNSVDQLFQALRKNGVHYDSVRGQWR